MTVQRQTGTGAGERGNGRVTESVYELLTPEKVAPKRRLIVNLFGEEKTSKTHWPLATCPEPIWHIIFDPNGEEIAKKIVRQYRREVRVIKMEVNRKGNKATWEKEWDEFIAATDEAFKENKGTLVVDTCTEMWELKRLAEFGRDSNVSHLYAAVNRDVRAIFKKAYASDMSTVVIHKMRDEYVKDVKSGQREPSMWGPMANEVQANIETIYKPKEAHPFWVYFHNCNAKFDLAGQEYPTDLMTFEFLLSLCFD